MRAFSLFVSLVGAVLTAVIVIGASRFFLELAKVMESVAK
jgi:hypothetical protein